MTAKGHDLPIREPRRRVGSTSECGRVHKKVIAPAWAVRWASGVWSRADVPGCQCEPSLLAKSSGS
jgi:hypothetical protein